MVWPKHSVAKVTQANVAEGRGHLREQRKAALPPSPCCHPLLLQVRHGRPRVWKPLLQRGAASSISLGWGETEENPEPTTLLLGVMVEKTGVWQRKQRRERSDQASFEDPGVRLSGGISQRFFAASPLDLRPETSGPRLTPHPPTPRVRYKVRLDPPLSGPKEGGPPPKPHIPSFQTPPETFLGLESSSIEC